MKYYRLGNTPFQTNAVPPKDAIELSKEDHNRLVILSIKEELIEQPTPDPLIEIRKRLLQLEQKDEQATAQRRP